MECPGSWGKSSLQSGPCGDELTGAAFRSSGGRPRNQEKVGQAERPVSSVREESQGRRSSSPWAEAGEAFGPRGSSGTAGPHPFRESKKGFKEEVSQELPLLR